MHAAIRENPAPEKKERSKPSETKNWKAKKLTYDERKQKLKVCCTPLSTVLHCHKCLHKCCMVISPTLSLYSCVSMAVCVLEMDMAILCIMISKGKIFGDVGLCVVLSEA